MEIVEEQSQAGERHRKPNGEYVCDRYLVVDSGDNDAALYDAIRGSGSGSGHVTVKISLICRFLPTNMCLLPNSLISVSRSIDMSLLHILQSRPHELWARFFGSSMKDDLRYTPSDCFETFPFPEAGRRTPHSKPSAGNITSTAPS